MSRRRNDTNEVRGPSALRCGGRSGADPIDSFCPDGFLESRLRVHCSFLAHADLQEKGIRAPAGNRFTRNPAPAPTPPAEDEASTSSPAKRDREDDIPEADEEEPEASTSTAPAKKRKKLTIKQQKELAKEKADADEGILAVPTPPKGRYANRTPGAFNHCAECGNRGSFATCVASLRFSKASPTPSILLPAQTVHLDVCCRHSDLIDFRPRCPLPWLPTGSRHLGRQWQLGEESSRQTSSCRQGQGARHGCPKGRDQVSAAMLHPRSYDRLLSC
jgi:hypothetical protein